MMRRVNWFYISLLFIALALVWVLKPENDNDIAFFGFAENLETEINYNYPVVVEKINVSAGQKVVADSLLIRLSRKKSKEEMEKEIFQITTLQNEMKAWLQKKENEKENIILSYNEDLGTIDYKIEALKKQIEYRNKLLQSIENNESNSGTLQLELEQLNNERKHMQEMHEQKLSTLQNEVNGEKKIFRGKEAELEAEMIFEETHKSQTILVRAPDEGLIGNINCREGEHIPAFKTLMTFYEPHSSIVVGFIHEDLKVELKIGDEFRVNSLIKPEIEYIGKVIGLGSRIIEIPSRLRKFPQIKSYGREITIQIPTDNIFLQKEKVGISVY